MASSGGEIRPDRMTRERRWERNKEINRLYTEEGLSLEQIAARFDLHPSTVSIVLLRYGVSVRRSTRHRQELAQRNQEIADLYRGGLSPAEVGARLDLRPSTVSDILRRRSVSLRRRTGGPPQHLRERNDEIARLYAEGDLTLKEIGERFDLSRERVRQIAKRAGARPRVLTRPRVPPEDVGERKAEIIRLYAEGLKRKEIAARVGLSPTGVDYIVRTAGVNRRRPGIGGWKKGTPLAPAADRRKRNQQIIRLYTEEGLTLREVGARVGMSNVGVLYVLEMAGVRRRKRWWRPGWPWRDATERTEEITRAYVDDELTLKQVGARFALSEGCVWLILVRAGVPRRRGSSRKTRPE